MIVDRVENAHLYYGIGPHIDAALKFLQEGRFDGISRLSLDDFNVNISCTEYVSRPMEQCKKENHRVFADIHVCLEGVDVVGYCNRKDAEPITEYDSASDKQFFSARMSYVRLLPGMFALTMPEDVHSAMMMDEKPEQSRKLIIKCKL